MTFRICDLATGAEFQSVSYRFPEGAHSPSIIDQIVASADLQTVVFGEFVWRLNAIDRPLILDCGKLRATAISSDGQLAITAADDDEYVHVWNLANGRVVRKLHVGDKEIHDLCISPDGKMLAVGTHSHEMQLWDVTAGELVLESWADSHVLCVSLTPECEIRRIRNTRRAHLGRECSKGSPIANTLPQ